jgi:hypothetical protein
MLHDVDPTLNVQEPAPGTSGFQEVPSAPAIR